MEDKHLQRRPALQERGLPEFSELVLACRHHVAQTITWGCVLSVGFMAFAWWGTDANYKATSLVRVKQQQAVVHAAQTNSGRADELGFVHAQKQIALSPMVLRAALADARVQAGMVHSMTIDDALQWLNNQLDVEVQAGSEVMSIVARHPSSALTHALSVAVTESYLRENRTRTDSERARREEELGRAAQQADIELQRLWERLNQVARDAGADSSHSLTIHDEIQLQAYREYAQQLRSLQLRSNELLELIREEEVRVEDARLTESRPLTADMLQPAIESHPELQAAGQRLALHELQIEAVSRVAASLDSPRIKRLTGERDVLAQQFAQRTEIITQQLLKQAQPKPGAGSQSVLAKLHREQQSNQTELDFLRARMAEIDTGDVEQQGEHGVQLEVARHAVDRQSRLTDSLWKSLEELRIEAQVDPRVSLISLAEYPMQADYSRRYKSIGVAVGLAWLLVILSIGIFEWQSCRVRHSDDLVRNTSLTIFGADSFLDPHAAHPDSRVLGRFRRKQPNDNSLPSGVQEAAARLMMAHARSRSVPSLMVTSASSEEPRHLASFDLACVFARFHRRVLLIDCDPDSTDLFKLMIDEELGDARDSTANPLPAIPIATFEPGLEFLPLGRKSADGEFLDPQYLRTLLDHRRGDYDAIVVNGPAMMSSATSLLFASQVDQTLIAVFEGVSRWNRIAAVEQLALDTNVSLAGAVLHPGIERSKQNLDLHCSEATSKSASLEVNDELDATEQAVRNELVELREALRAKPEKLQRPNTETQLSQTMSNDESKKPQL